MTVRRISNLIWELEGSWKNERWMKERKKTLLVRPALQTVKKFLLWVLISFLQYFALLWYIIEITLVMVLPPSVEKCAIEKTIYWVIYSKRTFFYSPLQQIKWRKSSSEPRTHLHAPDNLFLWQKSDAKNQALVMVKKTSKI